VRPLVDLGGELGVRRLGAVGVQGDVDHRVGRVGDAAGRRVDVDLRHRKVGQQEAVGVVVVLEQRPRPPLHAAVQQVLLGPLLEVGALQVHVENRLVDVGHQLVVHLHHPLGPDGARRQGGAGLLGDGDRLEHPGESLVQRHGGLGLSVGGVDPLGHLGGDQAELEQAHVLRSVPEVQGRLAGLDRLEADLRRLLRLHVDLGDDAVLDLVDDQLVLVGLAFGLAPDVRGEVVLDQRLPLRARRRGLGGELGHRADGLADGGFVADHRSAGREDVVLAGGHRGLRRRLGRPRLACLGDHRPLGREVGLLGERQTQLRPGGLQVLLAELAQVQGRGAECLDARLAARLASGTSDPAPPRRSPGP
jgi:hypothetical protein